MKDGDRLIETYKEMLRLEALKWQERKARDIWLLEFSKPMCLLPADLQARLGSN